MDNAFWLQILLLIFRQINDILVILGGWFVWGLVSITLAFLATDAALRRWSGDIYVWPARKVGMTLVLLLFCLIISAVWSACGFIFGGPATALAVLLPKDELRDADIAIIGFIAANAVIGLALNFVIFPVSYRLVTAHFNSLAIRCISIPLAASSLLPLTAVLRNTTSNLFSHYFLALSLIASISILWLAYLLVLDVLGAPAK